MRLTDCIVRRWRQILLVGLSLTVLAIWPALFSGFHLLAKHKEEHGHDDSHDENDEKGEGQS